MIRDILEGELKEALRRVYIDVDVARARVAPSEHFGDYTTNVAMVLAPVVGKSPREVAEDVVREIEVSPTARYSITKVEVAGPGFVNFYLKDGVLVEEMKKVLEMGHSYGKSTVFKGRKVMVEYTDPNPFKRLHIGHLMSNAIGESMSRLVEFSGAETKRACYQGDVGMHVAKAVYFLQMVQKKDWKLFEDQSIEKKERDLWRAYASGTDAYEHDREGAKKAIEEINKKIYDGSDEEINTLYHWGRTVSLQYFDMIYRKLGTKFDFYFFESETGEYGKKLVEEYLEKNVFEKSDGAVVFPGEKYGLHTRVFINSQDLPTYEAKELGLAKLKYDLCPVREHAWEEPKKHVSYHYDLSIVITGNEINEYFRVLLKVLELVYPELAEKTLHIGHGMLRLPTGKMSSRTGDVKEGEELIEEVKKLAFEKMKESSMGEDEKERVAEQVAIGAIKYMVLRQSPGRDIIFDIEKSLSFEGDSGPYLQYTYARTQALLRKAEEERVSSDIEVVPAKTTDVERLIAQFPEVVERAGEEYAPHFIATHLIALARAFNTYYGEYKIVEVADMESPYRVALAQATGQVLKNGLTLLGIAAPDRM